MESEKSPSKKLARKLWKIVRMVSCMMKKGIMVDLHMLLKQGKLASKFILKSIAMLGYHYHHHHHCYSSLTCRSNDITSTFISPREYEFSCSNTPLYTFKHRVIPHRRRREEEFKKDTLNLINTLDMEGSTPQFGFGHHGGSLMTMMDRPLKGRHQVDNDAEEFIKKFYLDLMNQSRCAAMESPLPPYDTCSI